MIIAQTDLTTYFTSKGTKDSVIKVHTPTNVFFEKIFDGDTFASFVVASYDSESNEVKDKKEFSGITDKNFFEAVDYFEKLIEQKTPQEQQQKQDDFESFGKFVYYKNQKESFINMASSPIALFIPKSDVAKVFTPPQTKKYGRLDMTLLDDPKYDLVRSKFALKYNEEESIEACSNGGVDLSEIRIYDMIPYSNGTEEEGEETAPSDVNQNSLSQSEIEGEDPQQRPPKNEQERQEQEQANQGEDTDGEDGSNQPTEQPAPDPTNQGQPQPTDVIGGELDDNSDLSGVAVNMDLIESFLKFVVGKVLTQCEVELAVIERDTTVLKNIVQTFPRIPYADAVKMIKGELDVNGKNSIKTLEEDLAKVTARIDEINAEIVDREAKIATPGLKKGEVNFHVGKVTSLREELKDCEENQKNIPQWLQSARNFKDGEDFGGSDETVLTRLFDTPIMVYDWPHEVKAFYLKRSNDSRYAKGVDVLAPEGYGEIVGGGERETDKDLLISKIKEHDLPMEAFEWYLDLRRYGSVPHAGFGLGLERLVAWVCKLPHVRESIPFPRMYGRLLP